MAHEILTTKLCELDDQFAQLHSRIRMSDKLSDERLDEEILKLQTEIEDEMELIHRSLAGSKAEISTSLLMEFETLKDGVRSACARMNEEINQCADEDFKNEKKILAAEYTVDFAVVIAKHALLTALEAVKSQKQSDQSCVQ